MNDGTLARSGSAARAHTVQQLGGQAAAAVISKPPGTAQHSPLPPAQQQLLLQMQFMRSQAAVQTQTVTSLGQVVPQYSAQQPQQQRLSVLDRPIMYGMDRSQFSAAQLSLLDSILTDQFRPSAPAGRH